jgi:hypothetical protein
MSDGWTIVGSLLAVIVGSASAIYVQKREWARQQTIQWQAVRRKVYGKYLGKCNQYHNMLCDLGYALREDPRKSEERGDRAEELKAEVTALKGEMDILSDNETKRASDALFNELKSVNDEIHDFRKNKSETGTVTKIQRNEVYRSRYEPVQTAFVDSVIAELKVSRSRSGA